MIEYPSRPIQKKTSVRVRGLSNSLSNVIAPIPYRQIVDNADWTPYFGTSVEERQKYGNWDSNDCWEFSPTKQIEIQMNALYKRGEFSQEAIAFFQQNGIMDTNGFFNISDQYYDCLSGNYGNGGTAEEDFQLVQTYGIIPHSMLFCTDAIANRYASQTAFDAYYYNPKNVTQAMLAIGQQSLKYFQLRYQRIGSTWNTPDDTTLTTAMKQAPLAYGVPVNVYQWNQTSVPSLVSGTMNHEVTGYKAFQGMASYPIVDNYAPFLKILTKPYSLNSVVQGIVTSIPVAAPVPFQQLTLWQKVWQAADDYLRSLGMFIPLGRG